jgi:coenzyme PQQ precursor peptide PqqA
MPNSPAGKTPKEPIMSWTTPVICEVSAGMEVTAYLAAGM